MLVRTVCDIDNIWNMHVCVFLCPGCCGQLCVAPGHATPCCAVLCCAVLCCAVLCCAVLCCAVLCCAVLCCAVLCAGRFSFTPRTGMMFTGDYSCPSSSSSSSSALCFNSGPVHAVAAACLKDPKCSAFAYNRADQGGYFKNAGGVASPTAGSDLYQRIL
jgi:hypothetical protein